MSTAVLQPSFLNLPAEIRTRIYDDLVFASEQIWIALYNEKIIRIDLEHADTFYPEVLATCRKICSEAAAVLYRRNTFVFCDLSDLERFTYGIGTRNAQLVRVITYHDFTDVIEEASRLVKPLVPLAGLEILEFGFAEDLFDFYFLLLGSEYHATFKKSFAAVFRAVLEGRPSLRNVVRRIESQDGRSKIYMAFVKAEYKRSPRYRDWLTPLNADLETSVRN